jgi:hypothetical protein
MVLRKIVAENELRVVAIAKEVAFRNWFDLVVVKFESMLVRELNHAVLLASDRFKKLI